MKLSTRVPDTLAVTPHGVGSIAPVALSREDVLIGVEEAAVRGLIGILQGQDAVLVVLAEGVPVVDSDGTESEGRLLRGADSRQRLELVLGKQLKLLAEFMSQQHRSLELLGLQDLTTAGSSEGLDGPVLGATTEGDGLDALVLHQSGEYRAGGGAIAVCNDDDVLWGEGRRGEVLWDVIVALEGSLVVGLDVFEVLRVSPCHVRVQHNFRSV